MAPRAKLALTLLAAWGALAAALYEDQAGTFDWYRQHIGQVVEATYAPGRDRFYVAAAQGLLAAVAAPDGALGWRRTHPAGDDALAATAVLSKPSIVVAASRGGRYLRAWDGADGAMQWEAHVGGASAPAAARAAVAAVALPDGGAGVAVVAADVVQVRSAARGALLWSAELGTAAADAVKLVSAEGGNVVAASYGEGSSSIAAGSFAAIDGGGVVRVELRSPAPLGAAAALSGAALAAVTEDGAQLCGAVVEAGAAALSCGQLGAVLRLGAPITGGDAALTAAGVGGRFTVTVPGAGAYLIEVSASGPRLVAAFADATAVSRPFGPASAPRVAVFGVPSSDGSVIVKTVVDVASGEVVDTSLLAPPAPHHPVHGPPASVTAAFPAAKPGEASPDAFLLVWSDHQLSLSRDGASAWAREEALAGVQGAAFIDLPAAKGAAGAGGKGGQPAAIREEPGGAAPAGGLASDGMRAWLRMQALAVMVQFKLGGEAEREELVRLRSQLSDKNLMHRDPNGFRKLIVVTTAAGKALALHNGDGRVVWAARYDPAAPPTHLLRWRRFHDLTHAPQLLLARAAGADGGVSYASVLDGASGRELERIELPATTAKIVPLPDSLHDGNADQFVYALIDAPPRSAAAPAPTLAATLLPGGAAAARRLSAAGPAAAFWEVLRMAPAPAGAAVIAGYAFDAASVQVPADGGGHVTAEARLAWSVAPKGQLLAVATRPAEEPLHTAVKVLGDRSLKFKYSDPSLVFVATADAAARTVTAALLSAADGAVLHQQTHQQAAGPVAAVVSENWAVYTLQDAATARQQVAILEVYDDAPRDLSLGTIASAVMGGKGAEAVVGAAGPGAPLQVLSQSFYPQVRAKLLSVTQTLSGINLKQLLVGTVTDQVFAMDVRYLDPRRPLRAKATPEEQEERLLPYSPLLPFAPLSYATQDKAIAGLRGMVAAPAGLESTSLVLAYGADLFYTRLAPARHFDSLEDDFNYGLLVVGLLALTAGTALARRYSREAVLQASWR